MSIFAEILCKQFPTVQYPSVNNYSFTLLEDSYQYNKLYYNAIKLIYNIYFMSYNNKHNSISNNKFNILNIIILNNKNICEFEKKFFLIEFYKAQKIYSAFRELAKLYKFKYRHKFEIDMDLCFNKYSNLNSSILINLLENNIIYKFRLSDLVNIINNALLNAPDFFAEPYNIRNPYTNLPFSIANLYNIYFKIKKSNLIMPIIFNLYFLANFNLDKFKNENECFIRDKCIDRFVKSDSINEQHEYIMKMFYSYHNFIYFTLHPLFPKKTIVTIFKNYLKSYLLYEYSLNPYIRETSKIHLEYKLALFSQLNPDFGKKIWIKKRKNDQTKLYYKFNDTVLDTSNLSNNNIQIPHVLTRNEIYNYTLEENSNEILSDEILSDETLSDITLSDETLSDRTLSDEETYENE